MNLLSQKNPYFLILAAKPASGKSQMIQYIMLLNSSEYNKDPFKYGLVFTGTSFNGQYARYIPNDFIHSTLDLSIIENLMAIQASQIENTGSAPRAFIILDDCLSLKAFSSQTFINLSTQYRHFNITLIISSQYIYRLSPTFREACTMAIIFRQTTMRSIQALYESYGGGFENVKQFAKYLSEFLGDYKFILYHTNSSEEDIKKLYPVFKAPEKIPEFNYEYD